jgi:ATP-dependent exoDNAse (exonuclease V) beta subunit
MQKTLASPAGRWVLAAHAEAATEQAWSTCEVGQVSQHVIDRVFVAEGCRWIVDYKTVRPYDAGLALLQVQAKSYRPQLARYAALFRGDRLPIRLAIYFPLQGELVELT